MERAQGSQHILEQWYPNTPQQSQNATQTRLAPHDVGREPQIGFV
jgi:hypothetical protein